MVDVAEFEIDNSILKYLKEHNEIPDSIAYAKSIN